AGEQREVLPLDQSRLRRAYRRASSMLSVSRRSMKVKAKRPIQHEGRTHQTGDVFETTDAKAKQLIESGHAEEHKGEGVRLTNPSRAAKNRPGVPPRTRVSRKTSERFRL